MQKTKFKLYFFQNKEFCEWINEDYVIFVPEFEEIDLGGKFFQWDVVTSYFWSKHWFIFISFVVFPLHWFHNKKDKLKYLLVKSFIRVARNTDCS